MSLDLTFEAIGTLWHIKASDPLSEDRQKEIEKKIKDRIDIFDKTYSRFRKDSVIWKMSEETGEYVLPNDADPLLSFYLDMYEVSGGLVTPLIGQTLRDLGYDEKYSLVPKEKITRPVDLHAAIEWKKPTLTIKEKVLLDFGAAGKGALVDIVGGILRDEHIEEFIVDAGGDILHQGKNSIRVGLENPENFKEVIGLAELSNKSIAGSAGNRRVWNDYNHIINPETLSSPKTILAVWAIAENTMLADGITTLLYFMPPEKIREKYNFEYLIVFSDRSIEASENFPGEIFS